MEVLKKTRQKQLFSLADLGYLYLQCLGLIHRVGPKRVIRYHDATGPIHDTSVQATGKVPYPRLQSQPAFLVALLFGVFSGNLRSISSQVFHCTSRIHEPQVSSSEGTKKKGTEQKQTIAKKRGSSFHSNMSPFF